MAGEASSEIGIRPGACLTPSLPPLGGIGVTGMAAKEESSGRGNAG